MSAKQFHDDLLAECKRRYVGLGDEFVALRKRQLPREIEKAEAAMKKTSAARAALGPEATRARITSANAKFHTAAEYLDRLKFHLSYLSEKP